MKKHLLVIADSQEILKNLVDIFTNSKAPFKCTYASSARQALEMLKYLSVDIVFIDQHLRGIDVLQLASAIRFETGGNSRLCLIGKTIDEESMKKARLLGVSDFIGSFVWLPEGNEQIQAILRETPQFEQA